MGGRFIASAERAAQLPDTGMGEVAFLGRSNVGKSTLLGRVMKSPKIVRTSRTPGRTQLMNYFVWDQKVALVDLPGYGYAKISKTGRQKLKQVISSYLSDSDALLSVVLLLDARRGEPQPLDLEMMAIISEFGVPFLPVVNKIDTIPKNRRLTTASKFAKCLHIDTASVHLVSGESGDGVDKLRKEVWSIGMQPTAFSDTDTDTDIDTAAL